MGIIIIPTQQPKPTISASSSWIFIRNMERTDCILGFQLDNAIVINGFLYRVQHIHIARDYVIVKRKLEALRNILLIKGNIHIKQFKPNVFTSLHAGNAKEKNKKIFHETILFS